MSRYKLKVCPTCNKEHKKRGPYCCRSCGNSRVFDSHARQVLSNSVKKHYTTENGMEHRDQLRDVAKMANMRANNPDINPDDTFTLEDFFLEPVVRELPDNQFVQDGDLWTEDF